MNWFVDIDEKTTGPFSEEEIIEKIHQGEITTETILREKSTIDWVRAWKVPAFTDALFGNESLEDRSKCPKKRPEEALVPCVSCEKMIDRKASACPNCGRIYEDCYLRSQVSDGRCHFEHRFLMVFTAVLHFICILLVVLAGLLGIVGLGALANEASYGGFWIVGGIQAFVAAVFLKIIVEIIRLLIRIEINTRK